MSNGKREASLRASVAGALAHVAAAQRELGNALRMPVPVPAGGTLPELAGVLTPRERQIVQALMNGHRATAIAETLGIRPGTARTHIRRLRMKLGAQTLPEAVLAVQRILGTVGE